MDKWVINKRLESVKYNKFIETKKIRAYGRGGARV